LTFARVFQPVFNSACRMSHKISVYRW